MTKRRGTSLVEMMVVIVMTAALCGVLATMYGYTLQRIGGAAAESYGADQATAYMEEIQETIEAATKCEFRSVGGGTQLVCIMPTSGTNEDGDVIIERGTPIAKSARGLLKYGTGQRVWYYYSDATGNVNATGEMLWRAIRNDDADPVVGDTDRSFTYYEGTTQYRWEMLKTVGSSIDAANGMVSVIITTRAFESDTFDAENMSDESGDRREESITIGRDIMWQNRRQ